MKPPKILALAASFRADSLNKKLLALAVTEARAEKAQVTEIAFEDCDAPSYRGEKGELPKGARKLADALLAHDGLLIAAPEYNWSVPGSLKNIIDWLSVDPRSPLDGKTALLMSATPSARGGISGLQQLRTPLEVLGCWVHPQLIGIGRAPEQLGEGALKRESDQQHLIFCVHDFLRATIALSHDARA